MCNGSHISTQMFNESIYLLINEMGVSYDGSNMIKEVET